MIKIYPFIMCGGAGTRLWPLSVEGFPKQFHALIGDKTMLQETAARSFYASDMNIAPPSFVCALSHEMTVKEQCAAIGITPLSLILEPCGRNTAPVAAVIATQMAKIDPEALILLLPADHHIEDVVEFWDAVKAGIPHAEQGYLTTFGIMPTHPETGYGYIKSGSPLGDKCVQVDAFVEKPDEETAETYIQDGQYFWNGGIFLSTPAAMIEAFERHAPDIIQGVKTTIEKSEIEETSLYLNPRAFAQCRSESIDYAIMEAAEKVAMVCPVNMGWTDIGSWEALRDFQVTSPSETIQSGNVFALDCEKSLIRSDGPFIGAIGLKDIIIVATKDSVLVTRSDRTQDVRHIVKRLRETDQDEKL